MKKDNNPYFSIIVPVYNVERYLKRCIETIIVQEFQDFEVIIIDDGSTDNSSKICDELSKNDERIKVIHKKNEGLGMARNTGIDIAKGKYILFVDSDDYILPDLLRDVHETMEQYNPEIIFYGFKRVNSNGKVYFELNPNTSKRIYDKKEEIINEILAEFISNSNNKIGLNISAWNFCIDNNFFKKNNLKFVSEREYISEDVYFYMDMFKYLSKVCFLNKPYYCYCQNESSLTTSYRIDRFQKSKYFYRTMQELAKEYNYGEMIERRLYGAFIASVMACLKMELANREKYSLKYALENAKKIYMDDFLQEAIKNYDGTKKSKGWKLFYYCINNKKYNFLSIALLIKYKLRGI